MSGRPVVDLYYSYRSPYCYLAIDRLAGWAQAEDIDLRVRPVLPLAVRMPEFFTNADPRRHRYLQLDAPRCAAYLGIPFRRPDPDPVVIRPDPLEIPSEQPYIHRLTRLAAEAARRGRGVSFTVELARLMWSGAIPRWTDGDHLARAVARAGLDLHEMDRVIAADREALDADIAANQHQQRASGHWGVPLMVHCGEPFFGQDRIEQLQWHVARSGR